jgi:Ca2+-binding EF-hand superfamily protein
MSMTVSGVGGAAGYQAVSGASARMPPQQKMSNLYNQVDTGGTGSITQSQFNQAFQTLNPPAPFKAAGASAVWNALDPNGTGQVPRQDFINGMKNLMVQLRQGGNGVSDAAQTSAAGTQALNILG